MFLICLFAVFLFGSAAKGETTETNPSSALTDGGLTTASEVTRATESTTREFTTVHTTLTNAETINLSTQSTITINTTVTENGTVTTGSPAPSPSPPTTDASMSTARPGTSNPTSDSETANTTTVPVPATNQTMSTMTNHTAVTATTTLSTEASGITTAIPTTVSNITTTTLQPTQITTSNQTTPAPPTTTQSPVIVCPAVPCPLESVCLNGTCQCLTGTYLLNGHCVPAHVFPGRLHLTTLKFQNEMFNRSSKIFQMTAANISATLSDILKKQPGYIRSDVVQLEPGSVQATVNNVFSDTTENQTTVNNAINEAIKTSTGLLGQATYTSINLCELSPLPCEVSTTVCTNTNGQAACTCKDGYISNVYSNTSCKACPSGQRPVGEVCEACPFGYAGFNCNDSALLAVVIISCVLGGILLILILALFIYCCWRLCSNRKQDISSSPYSTEDLNQPWPTGIMPIPRANSKWDGAPPIEMTEGGSSNVLVDKRPQSNGMGFQRKQKGWKKTGSYDLNPEEMMTFKGKNTSRYSYLVQGHENPYFLPGDEKKN
ncbi:protein HEG homolog 1 isoform X3 [Simochromis diagramma]|uniref:protein HEG homolog 1 isoform X3 n=1 Tax=Simochromis diagramma TaxID=43689 RepID=UPI001A7E3246|nr:protein HEG homolog 1 isoform X3 [Simochromis diagramma]